MRFLKWVSNFTEILSDIFFETYLIEIFKMFVVNKIAFALFKSCFRKTVYRRMITWCLCFISISVHEKALYICNKWINSNQYFAIVSFTVF